MIAKSILRRVLGVLLSSVMILGMLPMNAVGASIEKEWIVEFADSTTAQRFANTAGGTYLGGPFTLMRASKSQLQSYPAVSLTENGSMKGSSVSDPSDAKASEQYILTHKSWYAQDAWAALETFLASQETPLTPGDCATIRVAVLDSGIDGTHEDLASRVVAGWDAVSRAPIEKGTNSDVSADSHGTKVAGLIGAASDNGVGMVGAAWTFPVELIPVRVLDSSNNGTIADIVAAIYWAVDEGNADILNLSFGQTLRSVPSAMQTAVLHAVEEGVIVVAAAGNDGEYYKSDDYSYYPAVLDGVLPVGSTAKALGSSYGSYNNYVQRADFSNHPSYESECGKTFFYTPGEDLLTTSAGNSYEEFSGTSASTALLSGMLAALKSCADATGQPGVENYLSYCKYSYLGGLYYQDYKYMAEALAAGYTSGDVRFTFDGHLPYELRGTVTLSGILNDPAFRYTEIRLSIADQPVGTVARSTGAKQHISFTLDTTAFEDGYYYPYQVVLMGVLEDGTEEEIDHTHGLYIKNGSEVCTVTVTSGGVPLVGAKSWLFRSGMAEPYETDSLGRIDLPLSAADGSCSVLVVGEELLVWRKLTPYPPENRYSFGGDPALLTIRCSGDTVAAADGAAIFVTMPDGGRYEVGTVTGGETELWVDTDAPITFTVCGGGVVLSETVDLSGDDVIWDLDSAETAAITLTHDGKAPTEGTEGPVRFLGLEIAGFGEQLLAADGGSVRVTPGEYSLTGYVYWWDGNYYSNYAKVDLGTHTVTAEGLALMLGSGMPVAELTVDAETVTEGQPVSVTVELSDSFGNPVTEVGYSDGECSYREKRGNACLLLEQYDAETESWSQNGQAYMYSVPGSTTVAAMDMGTEPGQRRITFDGNDFFTGMADASAEFTVMPQETRPAATVLITMEDSYENTMYDVSAAAVLTDGEGNPIAREAYCPDYGGQLVIKLPVGGVYTLAVLAVNYSEAYLTVCQADLTAAAEGDEVEIVLTAEDSWPAHEIIWPEGGDTYAYVQNLGCAPFAGVPDYRFMGTGSSEHIGVLYTSGISEVEMYFDVMLDGYDEMENYEYPPVFTVKKTVDLSEASTLEAGLPETLTVAVETGADSAVLTPVITDAYGNEIIDADYVSRYGDMGGEMGGGDVSAPRPTMVYPVIDVYDEAGQKVWSGSAPFAAVTAEGLAEGSYEAVITWNSSDIHLTGEPVLFAVGGEPVLPAVGQAVPTGFTADLSGGAVVLSWKAPAGGCAGYLLLRDGVELARPDSGALTYTDTAADPGSYHMYTLYALSAEGDRSRPVTVGARLSAGSDTEAPVWGDTAKLTAEVGEGGISLSWSRAQDDGSGVSSYLLFCNGVQIAQLFTRRYTYSAVQPNVDYIFSVKAVDGAGNLSELLTAEPVSVSSGILGVQMDYARNRLGYMTGKTMAVQVKTTADLDSASITVAYTCGDGSTGILTPGVTGASGSFVTTLSLPDDFVQVDQITVICGGDEYTCLKDPVIRCYAHVEVEVDLADAAALYPSAVLTLYAPSVGYAYSYPISNMTGTVAEDVIADDGYRLTLADSSGNVLLVREVDLSANTRITLDGEDARFLQLTVAGGFAGLTVTVVSDGRTVSGILDETGTAVWSSGGRFLPVGSSGTVRIPELEYSEEITFDKVVNQKTVQPEKLDYEILSISVTVLDPAGKGISGVEIWIAGHNNVTEAKITGADGTCVCTFANRKDYTPYISVRQQRDDQSRCWASLSIPVTDDTAVLRPTPMYDQILIRPVPDMDVDPESVSYAVNGNPVSLKDGVLCAERDSWWKVGERIVVTAEYTADGVTYTGRAGYDLTTQTQTVELSLKNYVEVTVSLSDSGDPMKGFERHFAVYNADQELITAFSTYHPSSTIKLVNGEQYTILAGWDAIPKRYDYTNPIRATIIAAEGCEVALDMIADPSFGLPPHFVSENGFRSAPSVAVLNNGDVRVTLNMTAYPIDDAQIVYAYNVLTLPVGARDITSFAPYTFDEETGLMTFSENLVRKYIYSYGRVSFTISAEKIPAEFLLQSLTRYRYGGVEYLRVNNEFELADYLMQVNVPGRISASALQSTGLPLDIRIPCAPSDGKLEVYADDILLTAVAAGQQNRVVVHPENRLGECTLRVVYTAENGFTLSRAATCEITADTRPVLQSAEVRMGSKDLGDLVNPQNRLYYDSDALGALTCQATFSHPELVERVWLCGKTESEFGRFELFWSDEENAFIGEGQIGTLLKPFTALWIEFDEKTRSIEETADEVRGELTVDYDFTYTPEEDDSDVDNPYSHDPDPDLGEEVQRQALSDWEKYVELVRGGLFEMEEEDTVAALDDLFGEDKVWDLPTATDGESHFSMRYTYDPETIAAKLASAEAFTVKINGEERKVLVEFEVEGDDLYICFYGVGDLFIPAVPETDEADMAAAGSLVGGMKHLVKRHMKDGVAIRKKYKEYKWVVDGLKDKYKNEAGEEAPGGANDSGDPCGSGSAGGQTREERRQEIDEMFDEGWEASKAVAKGISMAGKPLGMKSSMFGSHLTKDGSVMHALFEMQKQRIHQIDDILDEMDEDAFADEPADPCEEGGEKGKKEEKERPKNGYQPVYPLVDPSGCLYEGAPGYPAVGVNAYLYYLEEDGETWTLWNSEDFGQGPNPYPSEANGYYGWDVLPGKWKVVFEGEGYASAESIVLDVPPPHLDVDVALTSTRNPAVADAVIRADGSIYLKFDHLMTTESVLHNAVTITLGSEVLTGSLEAVDQTVTALGAKQAALDTNVQTGVAVASIFRFIPDDVLLAGMTVQVSVDKSVLGYNGMSMLSDWSDRLIVPEQDASMELISVKRTLEGGIYLSIDDSYSLSADDWCAAYSDGFGTVEEHTDVDITWYSTDESVAVVDENGIITAVGGGIASIIGEYEGHTIVFGVSVTRAPITADAADNDVKFCRDLNLVLGKACYMWSSAANFRMDDPIEGDEKYLPVAWRIKEDGAVQKEGTLSAGESSVKVIYTPTVLGTLTGEIDYQKYVFTSGRWVAVGSVETAVTQIAVTEITALSLHTAPRVTDDEILDLSGMLIDISLSDGSVSTVGFSKLASYGITMNLNHGDTLGERDRVLILTHERTGLTLRVDLGAPADPEIVVFRWDEGVCTVERQVFEQGVIVIVASYKEGKMVTLEYLTAEDPTATLTGDSVKVFFLGEGTYIPIRKAMEMMKP